MRRLRDPRIWLGLLIAAVCLWYAFRGVDFGQVVQHLARVDWLTLLGLSVPAYVLAIYLRALRWSHLVEGITDAQRGPLFRATAVGFMANNIYPLRIGELVRAWHLGRATGASTSAIFGTVVLERVVDSLVFLLLAVAVLLTYGSAALGGPRLLAAMSLLPVLALPIVAVVVLRAAPERAIGLVGWLLRPLPVPLRQRTLDVVRRLAEGMSALRGRRRIFWVGFHSLTIWLVASVLPFLAGLMALDIDLGSPRQMLAVSYVTMTLVGIAVALPSSPGFFGTYHAACTLSLALFGVPKELAVTLGTVVHGVFWVSVTLLGLFMLQLGHESLGEIGEIGEGPEGLE